MYCEVIFVKHCPNKQDEIGLPESCQQKVYVHQLEVCVYTLFITITILSDILNLLINVETR